MNINELLELIKKGETETVEFKRRAENIAEEVSAMANHKGGVILVGVTDDGKIVGVDKREIERISNQLQVLRPLSDIKIEEVKVDGKRVVVIRVKPSKNIVFVGHTAYIKIGTSKRPLSLEELVLKMSRLLLIRFDELISSVNIGEANRKYFDYYIERRKKIRGVPQRYDMERELEKIGAAKGKKLTNAGVLFFLDDPSRYIPGARLRVGFFNRKGELIRQIEFYGPIWKIVDDAHAYLLNNIERVEVRIGARRERIPVYPEWSLREAMINAVVHRDYFIPSDVRILVYPDKLIVRSPGSFPPDFDIENPEHIPRNRVLCRLMYDIGYIERYGAGIERMMEECKEYPTVKLEIKSSPYKVDVIFKRIEEEAYLDEKDREIIAMIKIGRSLTEIANEIGISRAAVLKRIKKMISMGIVKKVGRGRYIVT